jgi:hypothetical protein
MCGGPGMPLWLGFCLRFKSEALRAGSQCRQTQRLAVGAAMRPLRSRSLEAERTGRKLNVDL